MFKRQPLARCIVFALGAAAVLWLAACGKEEPVAEAPVVQAVKLLTVGSAASADARVYPGRVSAVKEATVAFEVGGRIVSLPVREGELVQKGAVLARLDARDYEAKLAAARADRGAAEADYLRFQELLAKDAVSQREFEMRERNFEVAKSRIDIAEKDFEETELRAPFSGLVARKLVDDFENVQAKQPILLLQDAGGVEIKVDLPEADLLRIQRTAETKALVSELTPMVSLASAPGSSYPAKLKELATSADPTTRTFQATFSFKRPETAVILPGMTARITIMPPMVGVGGVRIPSSAAVADDTGKAYVWKVNESSMTVSKAMVTLGELTGADVGVESGLSSGDVIAVSGVHHLRDGMEIKRFEG
jgi:RND family efflux transporter MFP subunit